MQQPEDTTIVSVSPRENRGQQTHGFDMGCRLVGKEQNVWYTNRTLKQKTKLGNDDIDAPEKEEVLYTLANICTTMMRDTRRVVEDVARGTGGSLVTPPMDPVHIQRYLGYLKGFGTVDELATMANDGTP